MLTIAGVAVVTLMGLVYLALTFDASQNGTTTVVIAPPVEPVQRQSSSSRVTTPAGNSILPEIRLQPQTDQVAPPATEPIVEPLPTEVASATPAQAETELPAAAPLPMLNESDAFVFDELRGISGGAAVIDFLVSDQIVRKFVALVENISRGEYPQTGVPYQPIGTEIGTNLTCGRRTRNQTVSQAIIPSYGGQNLPSAYWNLQISLNRGSKILLIQ